MLVQKGCEEKSNEITAIKALLRSLALKGAIVTIDAIGCQRPIARTIVKLGRNYILSVKDNQPKRHEAIGERDFEVSRSRTLINMVKDLTIKMEEP